MTDTGNLKLVGVRLVALDQTGFTKALSGAEQSVSRFGEAATKSLSKGSGGFNLATAAAAGFGSVLGNMLFSKVQQAIGYLTNMEAVVNRLQSSFVGLAGRTQEMLLVAELVGFQSGQNAKAVNDEIMSIRSMGIETQKAADAYVQFYKNSLPLEDAAKLARVAQDAAVLAGVDSSEAFDRLIYGITTQQTIILKTLGIQVRADQVYEKYAATVNKTASALTFEEKAMAFLNATMEEGAKIAGAYETAMMSGGKQLRSWSGRILPDLYNALGLPLQGAFYQFGKGLNQVTELMTLLFTPQEKVTEGMQKTIDKMAGMGVETDSLVGKLSPLLTKLGALSDVLTERMVAGLLRGVKAVADFVVSISDEFESAAVNAFTWGLNIMVELGAGMIHGASSVLITVMNWISGLLSFWLHPKSPPKVAPDIDKWGAQTVSEWVKGFTQADFSMFGKLGEIVKNQLAGMVSAGKITEGKAMSGFSKIYENLAQALATGDASGVKKSISASMGSAAGAINKVVDAYLKLSKAIRESMDASKAYSKALVDEETEQARVNRLSSEYQYMVESGASSAQLKAKKEELATSIKQRDAFKGQRRELEKVAQKKARDVDMIQAMVEAVEKQVNATEKLGKAMKDAADAAKGGGGGGAAGLPDMGSLPVGGLEGFAPEMDKALKEAKTRISLALDNMWEEIKNKPAWKEAEAKIDELKTTWSEFSGVINETWIGKIKPAIDGLTTFLGIDTSGFTFSLGQVMGAFFLLGVAIWIVNGITAIWAAVTTSALLPIIVIIGGIAISWHFLADAVLTMSGLILVGVMAVLWVWSKMMESWNLSIGILQKVGATIFWLMDSVLTPLAAFLAGDFDAKITFDTDALQAEFDNINAAVDENIKGVQDRLESQKLSLADTYFDVENDLTTKGVFGSKLADPAIEEINRLKQAMSELETGVGGVGMGGQGSFLTNIMGDPSEFNVEAYTGQIDTLTSALEQGLYPTLEESGLKFSESVQPAVDDTALSVENLSKKVEELDTSLGTGLNTAAEDMTTMLTTMGTSISTEGATLQTSWSTFVKTFSSTFSAEMLVMEASFKTTLTNIETAGKNKLPAMLSLGKSFAKNVVDGAASYYGKLVKVGEDFVNGIAEGAKKQKPFLYDTIYAVALEAILAAKEAAGIASPSKVAMMEIGMPIAQGIALGIMKGTSLVESAASYATSRAVSPPASPTVIRERSLTRQYNSTQMTMNNPQFTVPQQAQISDFLLQLATMQQQG